MSFSIDRYKEESRKLDVSDVAWEDVARYPLSKGDLFFLHAAMDIENHVSLYLSHLLVTRACMDPVLTAFLACWNYEELWHGENLGRFLHEYGIDFDADQRIADIRANLGFQNTISILSTMVGSWLTKDFSAIYLTIGAINELSTATAYAAVARKSDHPVLRHLLSKIIKDERRHFAFYYNSAREWLSDNRAAQRIDRLAVEHLWVPIGKGIKNQEQVDAIGLYLFDDEQGWEDLLKIDDRIGKLPGLAGVRLMTRALEESRQRVQATPGWGWRLIENEAWAVEPPKRALVEELTGRRGGSDGFLELETVS